MDIRRIIYSNITILNIILFVAFFFHWDVKSTKIFEFKQLLVKHNLSALLPLLVSDGFWSVEIFLATPLAHLPISITNIPVLQQVLRNARRNMRNEVYLRKWLDREGVGDYERLETFEWSMDQLARLPTGALYHRIHERISDVQQRYIMRSNADIFQQAVTDFNVRSDRYILLERHFTKEIKTAANHFTIQSIVIFWKARSYYDFLLTMSKAIIFTGLADFLLKSVVLHHKSVIRLICFYYICPNAAAFLLYTVCLYTSINQPIKSLVYHSILEIWLPAIHIFSYYHYYQLLPIGCSIVFLYILDKLKFQPCTTKAKSGSTNLFITGIGQVNNDVTSFIENKRVDKFHKHILGLEVLDSFEWDRVEEFHCENCDINGDLVLRMTEASIKANRLKKCVIINNRLFDDNHARQLASLIKENSSLQTINISFQRNKNISIFKEVLHFLFWPQLKQSFTKQGAVSLVRAIESNETSGMKKLDIYGIELDRKFVDTAQSLTERTVRVIGCKPGEKHLSAMFWADSLADNMFVYGICFICAVLCSVTKCVQLMENLGAEA